MRRWIVAFVAVVVLAGAGSVYGAVEFINNGDFEGGFVESGTSHALDLKIDWIPIGWTRHETFTGTGNVAEESQISAGPDGVNGPSAPGNSAAHFLRYLDDTSGDWTGVSQGLNIDVADYTALSLSLDSMVRWQNLEAGGAVSPAFEWPLVVEILYEATDNTSQVWRHGWYINPPGDSFWGPIDDPGFGKITIYGDTPVSPNTWLANSFNLFNELPEVKTITQLYVGGSGWDFESKVDNVSLLGTPIPEPSTLVVWSLLGTLALAIGWNRRRKAG